MAQIRLLLTFLCLPFLCEATDLKPWFRDEYEVEFRTTALYQNYDKLSAPNHDHRKRQANDTFLTLSAAFPFRRYCGEAEATAAWTRKQSSCWDNFRLTGRYQIFNEHEDDALSLVAGLTLTEPFSRALHDVSSFHHGHFEAEATLAFGKKYGCYCSTDYLWRWWGVAGIGQAEQGSPWARGDLALELKYCDSYHVRLLVNTLWGMGGDDLNPHRFKGYGRIKHRSVDAGVRFGYETCCWGTVSIQYLRRVYALNFPEDANLLLVEYYLPFGTQYTYRY